MSVYRIEMQIVATAYIKAKSKKEALRIAKSMKEASPAIEDYAGEIPISGLPFHSPYLPNVSLSPAMMILGPLHVYGPNEIEKVA